MIDAQASLAVGAIALADCASDPFGCQTVLVGTGENSIRRQTYFGTGLLRGSIVRRSGEIDIPPRYVFNKLSDTDVRFGGGAINRILITDATPGNMDFYIAVSAGNTASSHVTTVHHAPPADGFGIHRSLDNGATWERLPVPAGVAAKDALPTDLEFATTTNGNAFFSGFMDRGIYAKYETGPMASATWCPLNPGTPEGVPSGCPEPRPVCDGSGLPCGLPAAGTFDHVEIAVAKAANDAIYAALPSCPTWTSITETPAGCALVLFQSIDGGRTWAARAATPDAADSDMTSAAVGGSKIETYSRYTHVLEVDPVDPLTVYFGGLGLWRSLDGGANFENLGLGTLHPDNHALIFLETGNSGVSDDILLNANDGGVAISQGGEFWLSRNDLQITQFYSVASLEFTACNDVAGRDDDCDNDLTDDGTECATGNANTCNTKKIIGGAQDNGILEFNGGRAWKSLRGGDGGDTIIDKLGRSLSTIQGITPAANALPVVAPPATQRSSTNLNGDSFTMQPPFVQHPISKDLYFGTDKLYKMAAGTTSWTALTSRLGQTTTACSGATQSNPSGTCTGGALCISGFCSPFYEDIENTTAISAIGLARSDPARVYTGTYDGSVYSIQSGTFTQILLAARTCDSSVVGDPTKSGNISLDPATRCVPVTSLAVHPANPNIVYATFGGFGFAGQHVQKFDGTSWSASSNGLTGQFRRSLCQRHCHRCIQRDVQYLGTDLGVFKRVGDTAAWEHYSTTRGMPNVPVYDVEVDASRNIVYAATHGRGVFSLTTTPTLRVFEGWMPQEMCGTNAGCIWDILLYGEGFTPPGATCTVKLITTTGAICAEGTSDGFGMTEIKVSPATEGPEKGKLVTDRQLVAVEAEGLPVVAACFNENCINNIPLSNCLPDPANPDRRVSSVSVECGGQPPVFASVGAECPSQFAPPANIWSVDGFLGAEDPQGQATGSEITTTGAITLAAATGFDTTTTPLCAVGVAYVAGDSPRDVSVRARDAFNGDPGCVAAGVIASVEPEPSASSPEDPPKISPSLSISAPGVRAGLLMLSLRADPGNENLCFNFRDFPGYGLGQLDIIDTAVSVGPMGAEGGTVTFTEVTPLGNCTVRVETSPGESAESVAGKIQDAFEQSLVPPGTPGCPWKHTPVDMTVTGANLTTIMQTQMRLCWTDPGLGFTVAPHAKIIPDLDNGAWPMFRHDAAHRGRSDFSGPSSANLAWQVNLGGNVNSSPAVGPDGTIYVGSESNKVFAINPNGTLKWQFSTPDDVKSSPAIGVDGTVFVGSDDGKIYALNPTGSLKWSRDIDSEPFESSPVIALDGTIYVGSDNNRLYALDPGNGNVRWTFTTAGDVDSSPAIGPNGTIYVGSDDNKLYAINPTGTLKWSFSTGGDIDSSPAVSDNGAVVYVASDDDKLYAVAAATGTRVWATSLGGLDGESSPAIGSNGTVYTGSEANKVFALAPSNGAVLWTFTAGADVDSSPAVDGQGRVFVGTDDNRVYALNGQTGAVVWSFQTGGDIDSSPAIGATGTLYVGSDDNKLHAFVP